MGYFTRQDGLAFCADTPGKANHAGNSPVLQLISGRERGFRAVFLWKPHATRFPWGFRESFTMLTWSLLLWKFSGTHGGPTEESRFTGLPWRSYEGCAQYEYGVGRPTMNV